jgi:hypothetical protein
MMKFRHHDFERIYNEFCKYYRNQKQGENEYYSWLNDLALDESKPYGSARESFQWAKGMLNLLKEDADNKYYGIIVGLPITSMNGNVYRERDLIAAALTLKGKHPSLNHKDEFWFKPGNPWGTITVEDAKYEEGAVEAVLKVPKSAVCPICNGDKMTQLIDEKRIVNVSLEGNNTGAFEFTDPPFTLLTSNVLPGIPLARIKPLERIVEEYVTGTKLPGRKNTMKIEVKVKEDVNQKVTQPQTTVNTNSLTDPDFKGTYGTPVNEDGKIGSQQDLAATQIGTPAAPDNLSMRSREACDCPPGMHKNPEGQCVPDESMESTAPDRGVDAPSGPSSDTSTPKPETSYTGPSRNRPPERTIPSVAQPPKVHASVVKGDSPAENDGVWMGTSPVGENLENKVARIKAESRAKTSEAQALEWEMQYRKIAEENMRKEGRITELKQMVEQANLRMETALKDMNSAFLERDKYKSLRDQASGERDDIRLKYERLVTEKKLVDEKYQNQLDITLGLSGKVTQANEDYLEVSRKLANTEEALARSRIEAKKILKIRT